MEINYKLNFDKIEATIEKLTSRIFERFPDSSLGRTCDDFHKFAKESKRHIELISKPILQIRILSYAIIAFILFGLTYGLSNLQFKKIETVNSLSQITDSSMNTIVLLGAALAFLYTLENRIRRKRALSFLNKVRGFAHVVDMHQLTKDPQITEYHPDPTDNSPKRGLTKFELERYLDYSVEFLSLIGKISAVYSQKFPDATVVQSSTEIESLCSDIISNVQQKLLVLAIQQNSIKSLSELK